MPKGTTGEHKLATYQAKRDFTKTAEPSGKTAVAASNRLRFIIQKHAATRLHYDLRLELDGVFKSWAVTRGPSLNPHDKRLAVEVEDHPLDYGDFEGTIPDGQYGGGTVQLWDRGFWVPEGDAAPEAALKSGDLKFTLEGDRLHGSWVLVRMKNDRMGGGKRTNWLLIKHQDEAAADTAATEALIAEDASVASGRSMADIEAGKGKGPKPFMLEIKSKAAPDAVWQSDKKQSPPNKKRSAAVNGGVLDEEVKATLDPEPPASKKPTRKIAAKAKTGILSLDFVPPQLCRLVDQPPTTGDWAHEIKFDGYRMQMRVLNGKVTLWTRKGLDWTKRFQTIAEAATTLPDALIDGEIVALDDQGTPDFAGLQAALSDGKTQDLIFYVFDLLAIAGKDLRSLPLADRKTRLQELLKPLDARSLRSIRYVEHFKTGGAAVLQSACRMSLEGIVSKRLDAPYVSGRSDSWTKSKCRGGEEVVIGGWTGSAGQFRSLLVGVHRGDHLVYVGRVGTGYGKDVAARLLPRLQQVASDTNPFTGKNAPKKKGDINWARPDLVAEIAFAGWTGDGMVRQASFKGLREDKPAAEVTQEDQAVASVEAVEPVETAKPSSKTRPSAKPRDNHVMGVVLSHPDKLLWPATDRSAAVSKLDLARYFEAVGDWMMPHLKGRPCSIIRVPDGIGGEVFFQRHAMRGSSALLEQVLVTDDHKPYLEVDRIEGLAAIAQIGGAELHPWNCQPHRPEQPGRLIFDLDPAPDVPFTAVIDAALEVKQRLEAIGLVAFCKTTGGKGLHVVTPLSATEKNPIDWPTAKAFTQALCRQMADDAPDRYVINMAKKLRTGRIFLDYLRNDRLSTAVAPLSPRARPGAPVSMPIEWKDVVAKLDPQRYTLWTVPALLKKSKAWADYCETEQPLAEAIKRFETQMPRKRK